MNLLACSMRCLSSCFDSRRCFLRTDKAEGDCAIFWNLLQQFETAEPLIIILEQKALEAGLLKTFVIGPQSPAAEDLL